MYWITRSLLLAIVLGCTCLAADPAGDVSCRVGGHVKLPGIHPIQKESTIISMIDAAGGEEAGKELKVSVIRKIDETLTQEISFSSLKSLRERPSADVAILKDDVIVVMPVMVN